MPGGNDPSSNPRIAIAFQGDPDDPSAWSGVPAGISSGLDGAGAVRVPIDARPPGAGRLARALRMSWADVTANPVFATASGLRAKRALNGAAVDGVVAIGSGFVLSPRTPAVTFEDMTVAQALGRIDPVYQSLSKRQAKRWRGRQQRIYQRSLACCATSTWVARSIRDDYGIAPERIHIVGLGRNIDTGAAAERDWSVPRFLFAGFDWERKRGGAVVEAFIAIRDRHPGATLDLVGGHPQIDLAGVTGHGSLPLDSESGQRKYRELLACSTCFLMPSTYEPFGIAYLDAGAAGVPSIGTVAGGAPDAVGRGGLVVDPSDEGALFDAMLDLCDPGTARRLGAQAQEHSALFTWTAVAERLIRALRPPGVNLDGLAEFLEPSPRGGEG